MGQDLAKAAAYGSTQGILWTFGRALSCLLGHKTQNSTPFSAVFKNLGMLMKSAVRWKDKGSTNCSFGCAWHKLGSGMHCMEF